MLLNSIKLLSENILFIFTFTRTLGRGNKAGARSTSVVCTIVGCWRAWTSNRSCKKNSRAGELLKLTEWGFVLHPHQCPLKHPPLRCLFTEQPQDVLACFFLWVPAVNSWHLSTIDYEVCWQPTLTVQSSGDRRAGFNNHPLLRGSFHLSEVCRAFSLGRYWHFVHKVNNSCFAPSQVQLRSQLLCFKAAEHWSLITASSLLAT